jgi:hypothetical protein
MLPQIQEGQLIAGPHLQTNAIPLLSTLFLSLVSSVREDELDAFGDASCAIEYFEMPFGVLHRSHHCAVAISQVAGLGENILVVELFREIPPIILLSGGVETIDEKLPNFRVLLSIQWTLLALGVNGIE